MEAQLELQELKKRDESLLRFFVEAVEITTPEQQKNCEDLLIIGRRSWKTADEKRKELIAPIREAEKQINSLFKPYLSRLELGLTKIDLALKNWNAKQKREAEALMIEQMKINTAQINETLQTGEVFQPEEIVVRPVPKTSHAHVGTVTYKEDWEFTVVDPDLVPRNLCKPDEVKIRAMVKAGAREIAGVLITPRVITTARTG
jgi:hypothetical protein